MPKRVFTAEAEGHVFKRTSTTMLYAFAVYVRGGHPPANGDVPPKIVRWSHSAALAEREARAWRERAAERGLDRVVLVVAVVQS